MIMKLLLIIAVITAVYVVFFKKPVTNKTKKNHANTTQNDSEMIQCSECGIYFETNEGILSNGRYFCSQECLNKGK